MTAKGAMLGTATADRVRALVGQLSDRDGLIRRQARRELEDMGPVIGPHVTQALSSKHVHVRWEAAKALTAVSIPAAAPALVNALMDESFEVQWLAAEALINLGTASVGPLMEGLIQHPTSVSLRQGAHHVLSDLERRGLLDSPTREVKEEVGCLVPREPYPEAARRALTSLTASGAAGISAKASLRKQRNRRPDQR
jgi:hypothetical protein